MKIRNFSSEDLNAILALQAENPESARWLAQDYEHLSRAPGGFVLVAELDTATSPKVVGLAAAHRIIDEAELRNLVVAREHQHQGIGKALLQESFARLRQAGARRLYLEVRPSNKSAIGLYSSLGFAIHSQRKDYYDDPREDAYVMELQLTTLSQFGAAL